MGNPRYKNGFALTLHPDKLREPLRWRNPQIVFANSMSDLFHEGVPEDFIHEMFKVMAQGHWHTFQILTKRAERLAALAPVLLWPRNVWMGVSVERTDYTWRIDCLRGVPAAVRFLSLEPLLGPLPELPLEGIHWVILGGESGGQRERALVHWARNALVPKPEALEWVRNIRDQCLARDVPLFFKQWGGPTPKAGGRLLDGRVWGEMPRGPRDGGRG